MFPEKFTIMMYSCVTMYSKYAKCGGLVGGAGTVTLLLLVLRKSRCLDKQENVVCNVCRLCKFNFTLKCFTCFHVVFYIVKRSQMRA